MANNGVTFALGLAQKAGKLASGDYAVRSALKNGKARLSVSYTHLTLPTILLV